MLHACKSDDQFRKMASLVLESWRQAGQSRIADIFQKEYIESEDHNNWRYGCFGLPGDSPQNNSIERTNLEIKGSSNFDGIINLQQNATAMFFDEFPKLIHTHSIERVDIDRIYRIDDPSLCTDSKITHACGLLTSKVDIVTDSCHGYFVNTNGYLGKAIDKSRIERYRQALNEKFSTDYTKRRELFEATEGLCHVTYQNSVEGKRTWMGNCMEFWKTTTCPHAVSIKYRDVMEVNCTKVDSGRKKFIKSEFGPTAEEKKLEYGWKFSGFDDGKVGPGTVAVEVGLTIGGLEGAKLDGDC